MNLFSGPVRVPEEAAPGIASVKISYSDWFEGNVHPAEYEVVVVEASETQ